jgi:hypothetical protein
MYMSGDSKVGLGNWAGMIIQSELKLVHFLQVKVLVLGKKFAVKNATKMSKCQNKK